MLGKAYNKIFSEVFVRHKAKLTRYLGSIIRFRQQTWVRKTLVSFKRVQIFCSIMWDYIFKRFLLTLFTLWTASPSRSAGINRLKRRRLT